ncbi:hypothetical protein IGI04_039482 [Brassica rapa subsp. trilocularis]|uniref:Reverse transcriptase zinc-binding domain-containing protein n=1 Tax=Brassica rapa subsp. trilocularis TaxID=1813537 RepID=A0ABQ7KP25_BRACM|nr:hypothetical protein IGI04_039482 [Brassica rapa subsp. trilocularis]
MGQILEFPPGQREFPGVPSHRVRHRRVAEARDSLIAHPLPNLAQGPDVFSWVIPGSTSPGFSSGLTWEHLHQKFPKLSWTRSVWFKGCIPKHAFTFWVAHLDRLPVRQRLVTWGIDVPDTCVLCNRFSESREHLFLECEYSKDIWRTGRDSRLCFPSGLDMTKSL